MEVLAVAGNSKVSEAKIKNDHQVSFEISFTDAVSQAIKSGKIVVPNKAQSAELNFEKNKLVDFTSIQWEDEEGKIHAFIDRIKKILEKSK